MRNRAADAGFGAVLFLASRGTLGARLTGATPGERFGAALATIDVDRDGRDELVVGAPGASGTYAAEGAITLVVGGKPAARILGGTAGGQAGASITVVPRGARSELVVSAPGATLASPSGGWTTMSLR